MILLNVFKTIIDTIIEYVTTTRVVELGVSSVFASLGLTMCALFIYIVSLIVYIVKIKKNKVKVNHLFLILMTLAFFPFLFEHIYVIIYMVNPNATVPLTIFSKAFLFSSNFWIANFVYYVAMFLLMKLKNKQFEKKELIRNVIITEVIAGVICLALTILLPSTIAMPGGPNTAIIVEGLLPEIINIEYIVTSFVLFFILALNRKKIETLTITPFIIIFVCYIIVNFFTVTDILHTNHLAAFMGAIVVAMFYTNESPDTQILADYRRTTKEKKDLEAAKQKFLVNVSHEVRTPMHTILGTGDYLLKKQNLSEEEFKKDLDDINKAAMNLSELINNMIDISNIETNKVHINEKNYDNKELIMKINELINLKMSKENLRFTIETDPNLLGMLYGDEEKIYKIITRILENAIEYTDYGEVKLTVSSQILNSDYAEMTYLVSNTGHAMTEESFNKEFDDLLSVDNNIDSTKLGVLIAKKLTDILGGEIEFLNEKGHGTRYIIKLRQKIVNNAPNGAFTKVN